MTTLEVFLKDISWSMIGFSEEQAVKILNSVNTNYATVEELHEDIGVEEDYTTHFSDINLLAVIENLSDLGDAELLTRVLNEVYGYNGTCADIYYLSEDDMYCLVVAQR